MLRHVFIGGLTRYFRRSMIKCRHIVLKSVIAKRHSIGIERVGFYNHSPRLKVFAMYILNHIGARQHKRVIAALQQSIGSGVTFTPEIIFRQAVTLNHRTHGTIQHQHFTACGLHQLNGALLIRQRLYS